MITADVSLPRWMVRLLHRWKARLLLEDWQIEAKATTLAELNAHRQHEDETQAEVAVNSVYQSAQIWLPVELPNNEGTERAILHELRHAHYAQLMHVFEFCFDNRRKLDKAQMRQAVGEAIETAIQKDVAIFWKMKSK